MKRMQALRLGKYSIPFVYLVPVLFLALTVTIFCTSIVNSNQQSNNGVNGALIAQEDTKYSNTQELGKNQTNAEQTAQAIQQKSNSNSTIQTNTNTAPRNTNLNNVCGTSLISAGSQSFSISSDQTGITYTFTAPNGRFINTAMAGEPGPYTPKLQGTLSTSAKMYVQYKEDTPSANRGTMLFYTDCEKYSVSYTIAKEAPKIINVIKLLYAGNNNITYEVDAPITRLDINYLIINCIAPDPKVCYGSDSVYTTAQLGMFSLDPYFPEIDMYFASYPRETILLDLTPIPVDNIPVGATGGSLTIYSR